MRRGFSPRIYFENGHLVAISTGSDACAEHECGSKELLTELCEQYANEAKIIEQLKRGECVKYPELLETKRIVRRSPHLKFSVNSEQSVPEAIESAGNWLAEPPADEPPVGTEVRNLQSGCRTVPLKSPRSGTSGAK